MESRKYKFNESTITIKFGNIIESQSDVIVSSDDCNITMGGGVSRAILRSGGEMIIRDARKMVPVSLGEVAVTTAGTMMQKYIFHCITIDRKHKLQMLNSLVSEDDVQNYIIQHAVDKCFRLIQAMDLTSIAFPTIGAGAARISIQKVIEQMSIAIARNLGNTNKSLNVELYLFDIYHLYSESDYIALFESFAAKAALLEYKKNMANIDEYSGVVSAEQNVPFPDSSSMNHKVFISYSSEDKEISQYVCDILEKNGIEYWIDKKGIYSSYNYKELIVDAIEVSKVVIFLSSANSNNSINVIREIGYAVNMNKSILPIKLDETPYAKSIRLDISDIDMIDFKNPLESSKKLITSLMYVLNK